MSITATSIVRDLAVEIPGATRVFEGLGIDYCCGGNNPLTDACSKAGLAVEDVVSKLEDANRAATKGDEDRDWRAEPVTALVSHILDTHHAFDRGELARIEPLLAKVVSVYRERRQELIEIQTIFTAMKLDLLSHMMKEEQVLFPYIVELQEAVSRGEDKPVPFFGTVRNPVRMMMTEHDTVGDMLKSMRQLSSNFVVPSDACVSYAALYEALAGLESDLHKHIHLENNLLFPRVIEMEGN